MAEGRILKKRISTDARWAKLANDTHRILFTVGIAHLDVEGRITGDPLEFKGLVAPLLDHVTSETVIKFFEDAQNLGLIKRYSSDGKWVVYYPSFKKNQKLRPDREAKSIYPSPPEEDDLDTSSEEKQEEGNFISEISSEISSLVSKIFSFPGGEKLYSQIIQAISFARKNKKISDQEILSFLKMLEQYPPEKIKRGIEIYLERKYFLEKKNEKCLFGIIQNFKPEESGDLSEFRSTGSPLLDKYYRNQSLAGIQ